MVEPTTSMPSGEGDSDEGLVSSRPPVTSVPVRTWVVQTVRELSDLRAQILAEIAPDDVGGEVELDSVAHHLVLVASELATNALRHGIPPTTVRLLHDGDMYVLDVADHDLSTTPYIAGARPPGMGGFGLQIARRLAVDVGWYATHDSKHVWAQFPAPG